MKNGIASFLSTRKDTNGNQLSQEILDQVVETQPKVPVVVDFTERPVGVTIRYHYSGPIVWCEFEVEDEVAQHQLFDRLYLLPVFNVLEWHRDGTVKIVTEATLTHSMLSYLPGDPAMSMIRTK